MVVSSARGFTDVAVGLFLPLVLCFQLLSRTLFSCSIQCLVLLLLLFYLCVCCTGCTKGFFSLLGPLSSYFPLVFVGVNERKRRLIESLLEIRKGWNLLQLFWFVRAVV